MKIGRFEIVVSQTFGRVRPLKHALRYWYPQRLTLKSNPRIHAWLWWNF